MTIGIARRTLAAAALALAAFTMGASERVEAAWPERPVTIIVCFPAGGGTDIAARLIQAPLEQALGQPVIIENRGGAGGNIGISAAQRATPDGYTLLACSSAFVVNPSLYASVTYDPFKDFVPITVFGAAPNAFVVPAGSDIKTFGDLVAKAKANPGKVNWTSPGAGTTPYLAGELIKLRLGIDMLHIPFPGAGPATQAAVAGQVEMLCANLGSVGALIASGSFRPLAITAKERWAELPNVPTLDELGVKDAESDTFQGLLAPAGTPKAVVDRVARELKTILARPDLQGRYLQSGLKVLAEGPDVFAARIAREVPMYKAIIDAANIKIR